MHNYILCWFLISWNASFAQLQQQIYFDIIHLLVFHVSIISPICHSGKADAGEKQAKLDDEEVFFGPVGFTEKCIAAGVAEEVIKPLSPLCPDQIAELAKEAYSVAFRIANVKVSEKFPAESPSSGACQKQSASLLTRGEDIHTDQSQGAHQKDESAGDSENSSARQQKRCSTFTKETAVDRLLGSPGKERKRQGTFTKEKPVENLASACTVQPREEEEKTAAKSRAFVKRGSDLASKIRPPISRLMKYNSQSKLKVDPSCLFLY